MNFNSLFLAKNEDKIEVIELIIERFKGKIPSEVVDVWIDHRSPQIRIKGAKHTLKRERLIKRLFVEEDLLVCTEISKLLLKMR